MKHFSLFGQAKIGTRAKICDLIFTQPKSKKRFERGESLRKSLLPTLKVYGYFEVERETKGMKETNESEGERLAREEGGLGREKEGRKRERKERRKERETNRS